MNHEFLILNYGNFLLAEIPTIHNLKFRIRNSVWLIIWVCLSMSQTALADQQGGQRPAAYLRYGFGGPQGAMAGAAVGTRNDVACGYWNPAGLSGLRGLQTEAQDILLPLGQQIYFLSVANGFQDKFFYGFTGVFYTPGGDLEARKGPTFAPDSLFSDTELAFLVSVAVRISPRWSFGANLTILSQNIGVFAGLGFGEDLR